MSTKLPSAEAFRRAGWLPLSPQVHKAWLGDLHRKVDSKAKALEAYDYATKLPAAGSPPDNIPCHELIPAVQEFKDFIESDPTIYSEFIRMFESAKDGVCVVFNTI
jgi:hypothetical protein